MFDGSAEVVMTFYVSHLEGSEIKQLDRHGPGGTRGGGYDQEGDVHPGRREFLCNDSPLKHAFTFAPSVSWFVDCDHESELECVFN